MTVMSFYSGVLLTLFLVFWIVLLMMLWRVARQKRDNAYSGVRKPVWLHEAERLIWLARSIVGGICILLFIVALYEASLSSFLQRLSIFPILTLIPIQVPVDAIGASLLHRKGRHYVEHVFSLNFPAILPYLMLPPFLFYESLAKRRESLERQRLEEFAESLPTWMRVTLLRLDRSYGHAKRRAQLNLTTKRPCMFAEKGLAIENRNGELQITNLGTLVASVPILPKQVRLAGREDVALRMQGSRGPKNPLGVSRRIASVS